MTNPLFDTMFKPHVSSSAPFLIGPDRTPVSYRQFIEKAAQFAHVFSRWGLEPGDRLAAQVEKSFHALAVYAACVQSGLVYLPLNTAYTPEELNYFINDSVASAVLCGDGQYDAVSAIADSLGCKVATLNGDGTGSLAEEAKPMPVSYATVDRAEDDLAALLYTSGTTGRSKGAMLTHRNIVSNAIALARLWQFTKEDRLLHALPIFHTHGLFVATNVTLVAGGSMYFLPSFSIDAIVDLLPHATAMMGVPTFYTRLLKDARLDGRLTKDVRVFISGSAPLLAATHDEFFERTGHRILERYGMTETNMICSNPYDGERRAGTVGFPLPDVEVRISDPETGVPIAPGEIGSIEVKGPNVFSGYWNMPEKTAAEFRADGFFITGDLGKLDAKGYVHIVGRSKDLIISGGYNIYPKEIEQFLDDQNGVIESAVVGVPHPDFGETVVGCIVQDPDNPVDLDAIMSSACLSLARYKHPRKLLIVDSLPRNAMGKVQKSLLSDRFKDMFGARSLQA